MTFELEHIAKVYNANVQKPTESEIKVGAALLPVRNCYKNNHFLQDTKLVIAEHRVENKHTTIVRSGPLNRLHAFAKKYEKMQQQANNK